MVTFLRKHDGEEGLGSLVTIEETEVSKQYNSYRIFKVNLMNHTFENYDRTKSVILREL